jgi:hypothetical protein
MENIYAFAHSVESAQRVADEANRVHPWPGKFLKGSFRVAEIPGRLPAVVGDLAVPVEAYGIKGFKREFWTKTFRHVDAMNKWAEDHDAEVIGTRSVIEY